MPPNEGVSPPVVEIERSQAALNVVLIDLLSFQRAFGIEGIGRLVRSWDAAGLVEGFNLSEILPGPKTLGSAKIAQAKAVAEMEAAARAIVVKTLRGEKEEPALLAKEAKPYISIDTQGKSTDVARTATSKPVDMLRNNIVETRWAAIIVAAFIICMSILTICLFINMYGYCVIRY